VPIGLAAAIWTTLKPLKISDRLLHTGRGWHGLLPTPASTAFKNLDHPPQEQSMTRLYKGEAAGGDF